MSPPEEDVRVGATADLLDAVLSMSVAMSGDHDLAAILRRVVGAARELTGARYAALGVLSASAAVLGSRRLAEFHVDGIDPATAEAIGPLPRGHGVLGVLIDRPETLRLSRLGDHPDAVGFPPGHPPMTRFLGVPIRAGGTVFGNLYLTDREDGQDFDDADAATVAGLAAAAGVAIENARLLADAEVRQRWSAVTAALVPELVHDVTRTPTLVVRALVEAGVCDAAGVALAETDQLDGLLGGLTGDRRDLVVRRAAGLEIGLVGARVDAPPRARVLSPTEQRHRLGLDEGSSAVVACATADRVLGALVLHRSGATWLPTELAALDTFADDVARAVEHARHRHNWQLLAVYTDRDRIARDLHDHVIQRLFAVGLGLQGAVRRVSDPRVADRLERYVGDLDVVIAEIRSTVFALQRPDAAAPLPDAVRQIVQDSAAVLGFEPLINVTGPLDSARVAALSGDVLAALREGLANVIRHARAARVAVTVEAKLDAADDSGVDQGEADPYVLVRIEDDGIGLHRPAGVETSGLANLATRATSLGGTLDVADRDGGGTVLSWRVPLPET